MKGVPSLDLTADQYEIVASEEKREISLSLAGSTEEGFHVYEIHAGDGGHVLDLFEYADRPRLALRPPNGDPALLMDHEGGWENYTLRTASRGNPVGTIEYTQRVFSYRGWDLYDPDGALRANVTMASGLWAYLTASPRAPLDATSPDGEWLGTFELSRDGLNYGMEIELTTAELPPAVGIALSYSVFRKLEGLARSNRRAAAGALGIHQPAVGRFTPGRRRSSRSPGTCSRSRTR